MKRTTPYYKSFICTCFLISISVASVSSKDLSNNGDNNHNHHSNEHNHVENLSKEKDTPRHSLINDLQPCNEKITAQVNGLVCDFCARALEKVFSKKDQVLGISVNLDQGLIDIQFKPNQLIDEGTLTQLITDSGYNVVSYQHGCPDE